MYTLEDVYKAIGDSAYVARGQGYVRQKRVQETNVQTDAEGNVTCTAQVRGHGSRYAVSFVYAIERNTLEDLHCNCPVVGGGRRSCKHIAALMISAACMVQAQADKWNRDHFYERMERARAESECERRDEFVRSLVFQGQQQRKRAAFPLPQQKVRIEPVLVLEDGRMKLELRIGVTKMYVVRNLAEFASRIREGACTVYGKALTFSHSTQEVSAQDAVLMDHIVMLAQGLPASTKDAWLRPIMIDSTMRLLMGREIGVKDAEGVLQSAVVKAGCGTVKLRLEPLQEGTRLRVAADSVICGDRSAVFFLSGTVLCLMGEDFGRLDGLLRIRKAFPDGLMLTAEQLQSVCAQVIAPARAMLDVESGLDILYSQLPMQMTPRFYVDMDENNRLCCRLRYDYGLVQLMPGEHSQHVRRDTILEEMALSAVRTLFPVQVAQGEYAFEGSDDACFTLLSEKLNTLGAIGEVLIQDKLANQDIRTPRTMNVGIRPEGAQLLVTADFGGFTQRELEAAYMAYRQKRRYVRLPSGAFLSGSALEQAADAGELTGSLDLTVSELKQGVQTPISRALYLDETLKVRKTLTLSAPDALHDWVERIRQAQNTLVEPPETLQTELRGYQLTGLCWLCALADANFGGILADDMGLGKTVQALALLLHEREAGRPVRALVVCPASLQLNWCSEAARFAPALHAEALMGSEKTRAVQIADPSIELLITSYDQLRRDAKCYAQKEFTHLLLDEAQYIKNAASLSAKAVKGIHARHRFAMTGTPIENRLSELWSIFDFLMPGYLHSYKKFKDRFEAPVVRDGDEQARSNLHRMVAPFVLRRMKRDVLSDLPDKSETIMTSEMTQEQSKLYHAYLARLLESENFGMDRMQVLAGLTRLRQICCDPRLCVEDYAGGSGKLEQLLSLVRELVQSGHRMLIFSQFTSMLALLERALDSEGISLLKLTGQTDKQTRMDMVETFNHGDIPVFLISLKAGGTGLNLTGADVVIHYDPWWNTAAQNQATDRAYRIGQTRGVQVISLIASDTVEERIVLLQQAKSALSDGVLLGDETLFTLDAQALREILRA